MGCDIHTAVEVQHSAYTWTSHNYSTGRDTEHFRPAYWSKVKSPMWDNAYYYPERPIGDWNTPYTDEPYTGRNYTLFAWLAGVRHNAILPIDSPRGVPEDASKSWKKYVKKWGADLHSTSYFTLQELIDSEKVARAQTFTETGVLSLKSYLALKDEGILPESWCGWTSAPTMTADAFEALTDTQKLDLPKGDWNGQHIQASWERSLWESVEWFYEHTVERMKNLIPKDGDASQVRFVFGFDN